MQSFLTEGESRGAIKSDIAGQVSIDDVPWYHETADRLFRQPLLDFLFDERDADGQEQDQEQDGDGENSGEESRGNGTMGGGDGTGGMGNRNQEKLLRSFVNSYANQGPANDWLLGLQRALAEIFSELGIGCEVDSANFESGPRIVRADIKLGRGVTIKKIETASRDLANRLFSHRELFTFKSDDEAPKDLWIESVPRKGMLGIHVPRRDFSSVPLGYLLKSMPTDNSLRFVVGLNVIGEPQYSTLGSMPHLLVSGQTGAGKSVFLSCMILALAFQNSPERLQFTLVDPKGGLEFSPFDGLPHVRRICIEAHEVAEALAEAREDMDARYARMAQQVKMGNAAKTIQDYNGLPGVTRLPLHVIVIDEFADLILSDEGKAILKAVQAIAQKGRAAGVHVVVCTQRPDVKVIPGNIKAVIPSRLSFRLPEATDSQVILDKPGAENLFGRGDMLLKETSNNALRRFQGAYVEAAEVQKFVRAAQAIWPKAD